MRSLVFVLLAACVDLDGGARYQPPAPLDADSARLCAEADKRNLASDPSVTKALEAALLDDAFAVRQRALGRELTADEKKQVQDLLAARATDHTLAGAAREAGYLQHPAVVQKLITALEDDELKKAPASKAKMRAVYDAMLSRFDPDEYTRAPNATHPELVKVKVWEAKNRAFAAAIPKMPSPPSAAEALIARSSTTLPEPVVAAAFAIERPGGFSPPVAHDGRFYVVQRQTKIPATPYSDELVRPIIERDRRPAIRRALLEK